MVARAGTVFDANGDIVDEKIRDNLRKFVEGFAAHVAAR
jgi:chromate reductase